MNWLVVLCFEILDLADNAFAIQDFAEDNMLAIQVRSGDSCHEELGTIGACEVVMIELSGLREISCLWPGDHKPGPALAIERSRGLSCFSLKFSSSNFSP